MKRKKLTIISILVMVAVLLFVVFVGIPRFHDKISRGSYLRGTILSLAKVAVLIRDRFLGHTIGQMKKVVKKHILCVSSYRNVENKEQKSKFF